MSFSMEALWANARRKERNGGVLLCLWCQGILPKSGSRVVVGTASDDEVSRIGLDPASCRGRSVIRWAGATEGA